jgi:hypothetical protein
MAMMQSTALIVVETGGEAEPKDVAVIWPNGAVGMND